MTSTGSPLALNRSSVSSLLPLSLGGAGLILWLVSVSWADFSHMGALGLVTLLGWPYFLGLALVIAGFTYELAGQRMSTWRLVSLLVVLVVMLYGSAPAIEPEAALTDSWLHSGFIQYILTHGQILNGFDARFSWPGAFSLGAALVTFVGKTNAFAFLKWFPLVIELLYMAPLLVISRTSGVSKRAGWVGLALYYVANWIYQDYFSPQALNYLFYLVIIATVLVCWRPRAMSTGRFRSRAPLWIRINRTRQALRFRRLEGEHAELTQESGPVMALFILLSVILFASAMSHQLTPYATILALGALLMTRRLGRPELLVVAVIAAVAWLSLGASNFWVGHLQQIFGSAGQLSSNFNSGVTSRVTGSSSHRFVVDVRLLSTAGIYALAGIGALRRYASSRSLEFLIVVPFVLVAAQNYGGEGMLRVVLFGLPFVALLAASSLFPSLSGEIRPWLPSIRYGRRTVVSWAVASAVVIFGFAVMTTVARGGNDAYEAYSTGEFSAVDFAYSHAKPGEMIGMVAPYLPLEFRSIPLVQLFSPVGGDIPPYSFVKASLLSVRPTWIVLSKSQESWGEIVGGYQKGWELNLQKSLVAHRYLVVAHWSTATVLKTSTASEQVNVPTKAGASIGRRKFA